MICLLYCFALLHAAVPAGEIAFVTGTEQEDQRVCVLDMRENLVVSVGNGKRDGAPRWSPDGQWIAFESQGKEGMGIWVVRPDGKDARQLSKVHAWNHGPRWSPDASRLAYTADAEMGLRQVLVVCDIATGEETVWGGGRPGLLRPIWLPALELMKALQADAELKWEGVDTIALLEEAEAGALFCIGIVGEAGAYSTEVFLVTQSQAAPILSLVSKDTARYAEWAIESNRKGEAFAYESNDGGDREIFVLGKRGIANVSNHRSADWNPVWSPDGEWIAFESFRGGQRGVYRLFQDTTRSFPVDVSEDYQSWSPAWSPDGDFMVYVSDKSGTPQLYLHDIKGEKSHELTSLPGYADQPVWRPEKK
jgi:Tol biopolymer transport system component